MRKLALLILIMISLGSCVSKENLVKDLNQCYDISLIDLKKDKDYKNAYSSFVDTFKILCLDKKYFGVSSYVYNKIDEYIFFNETKSKCLMVVLQKMNDSLLFGKCRIIYGFNTGLDRWFFKVGRVISFGYEYFDIFKENSFINISKLARYSIWIQGNTSGTNCRIDEQYWFSD